MKRQRMKYLADKHRGDVVKILYLTLSKFGSDHLTKMKLKGRIVGVGGNGAWLLIKQQSKIHPQLKDKALFKSKILEIETPDGRVWK